MMIAALYPEERKVTRRGRAYRRVGVMPAPRLTLPVLIAALLLLVLSAQFLPWLDKWPDALVVPVTQTGSPISSPGSPPR